MRIAKLGQHMAVAVEGIDLNHSIDNTVATLLRDALLDNLVLCIRGQSLDPLAFRNGMAMLGKPLIRRQATQHPAAPEVNILSSEDRDVRGDGKRIVSGGYWHTDDSFKPVPCSLTMLYAIELPPFGGDTQFVNMYAAYDDLSMETRRRIEGMRAVHAYYSSRSRNPVVTRPADEAGETSVVHPLVRTHPETGRKALYMNPNRMEEIIGLDRAESDHLLDELIAHATQEKYEYRHKWRASDIVIWDNRCTMHKANADYPEGTRRLMYRIVVEGTVPR